MLLVGLWLQAARLAARTPINCPFIPFVALFVALAPSAPLSTFSPARFRPDPTAGSV